MVRPFNLTSLLAGLVFSIVIVIPFQPFAKTTVPGFFFQIGARTNVLGNIQLFYDVGRGINENDSKQLPLEANVDTQLKFPLPIGEYRSFRLDPLDRETHMKLTQALIVDRHGRTVVELPLSGFKPTQQISSSRIEEGVLEISTTVGGYDPILSYTLDRPITLWHSSRLRVYLESVAYVFAGWVVLLAGMALVPPRSWEVAQRGIVSVVSWSRMHPSSFVALVGFVAMVASSYPVIFAGKSFVSPNFGVALLYQSTPALPGITDEETWSTMNADVGAIMWSHIPLSSIQHRALFSDGELPLWNRYNASGAPLLGQGQSCFGDPLHFLPILAEGAAWAWDVKYLIAKWLLACGLALTVWSLTRHLPSAVLIAASAPFIGFFVYRVNHPAIFSVCYAPWILYCWSRILRSFSLRGLVLWCVALVAVNGCELTSGTAKEAYMLLVWLNAAGGLIVLFARIPWRQKRTIFLSASSAGVLFALITSPVWLTFFDSLSRSYNGYQIPNPYQLQPGMLAGLFDEIFYRPFQAAEGVINPSANFFLLIGVLWLAVRWRATFSEPVVAALVCAATIPFVLAFGMIPRTWIMKVPFLANVMHVDNTFSCVLLIIIGVLAGYGWRDAWERLGTKEGTKDACAVLVLMLAIVGAFVGTSHARVRTAYENLSWGATIQVSSFVAFYGWSLILASIVGLSALHLIRQRQKLTVATLLLVTLAFVCLHWREGLHLGVGFPSYHITPAVRADFHAKSPGLETLLATRPMPFRVAGIDDNFLPGWSGMYGLEGIGGPDALINKYYRQLLECCDIERVWDWRYLIHTSTFAAQRNAFDFINLRYFLDYRGDRTLMKKFTSEVVSADINVYESPTAWPRAFFTDRLAVYNHPLELANMIKTGDGRPFAGLHKVDLDPMGKSLPLSSDLETRRVVPASEYKLTTNTTTFTIEAPGPGVAVLSEAYLKDDFRVTLNGARSNYFRVNHAFKGVFLDHAGSYVISFSYWPRHFTLSLIASALGCAMLVVCLILVRRPRASVPLVRRVAPLSHA